MNQTSFVHPTLTRRDGELWVEDVSLSSLADTYGTPSYIYSKRAMVEAYRAYSDALKGVNHHIAYAMKANSNLAVLKLFADLGAGFDLVSAGELARVRAAGGDLSKAVFSGVGKTAAEIRETLRAGIHCFNIESEPEMHRLNDIALSLNLRASVAFRVNPEVDPKTHPYISTGLKQNKFGVAWSEAPRLYREAAAIKGLRVIGVECHIGSQITELAPYRDALAKLLELADSLKANGIMLEHISLGGGIGIRYSNETPISMSDFARMLREAFANRVESVHLEPGRSLVGNAGLLLTSIEFLKRGSERNFAIVDAAMNDLIRPALYEAHHEIVEVSARDIARELWQVVGPVCESGDFIALDRSLKLKQGDRLAALSAGAYSATMASNYNSRGRAPEIMVDGKSHRVVRAREDINTLFALESI